MHRTRHTSWLVVIPAICVAATLVGTGIAGQATLPHQFTNGTVADADQINQNFNALRDEINDNDTRLAAVESSDQATQYLMIYGASFVPDTDTSGWFRRLSNVQYSGYETPGSTSPALGALSLPNGARIRRIRAVVYDTSALNNVSVGLISRPFGTGTGTAVSPAVTINLSSSSGNAGFELVDSGPIDLVLDTSTTLYNMVIFPLGTWEAGRTMGLSQVQIEWTRN